MEADLLTLSPDPTDLVIDTDETRADGDLNLDLLDEMDEEVEVLSKPSILSDLVQPQSAPAKRPSLPPVRVHGQSQDPRLVKKLRMSSGCVGSEKTSASVSGATLKPGRPAKFVFGKKISHRESSSASESGSPGSGRFSGIKTKKIVAGTHMRGAVPFLPPVQSPSRVQLNRGPQPFRFGGPIPRPQETEISLDQEIEKREMNLRAEQEKIEELKLKKAATVAQRRYDSMDWQAESGSEMEAEQFAAVTAMRREAQMMMQMRLKIQVEQQMLKEEKMKLEKDKEILKLKEEVNMLQVQAKFRLSGNVKDRLGLKNNPAVASNSINQKQVNWGRNNNKNQMEVWDRSRQQTGVKRKFKFGQNKYFGNKNNNHGQSRLPDDLVMTNITEDGPRKARPRIVFDSDLPADLILTEFTEDGPKPKVFKSETKVKGPFKFQDADDIVLNNEFVGEDDDKVVNENDEEEQESDLNRYEDADNLF